MTRIAELRARRRMLLARCEAQRAELGQRMQQLYEQSRPGTLAAASGRGPQPGSHPFAWIAALAGLMLFGRTREVLKLLVWVRAGLSIASRVAQLLRMIAYLRARRASGAAR
jgi:hypothetical protein